MRVAIVDTYYPAFLAAHYAERPALARRSYDEQLAALMERCFGTSDAYSRYLRELGHEAVELVVNCFEVQRQWAREHGRSGRLRQIGSLPSLLGRAARDRLNHEIAAAQIARLDPDVVYLQDLWFFGRSELDRFRREGRLVVGQIASAPPGPELLGGFDLITTSFPHFVERFRAQGVDAEYLKIAFYEPVLERLRRRGVDPDPATPRECAITFVGGLDPSIHGRGTELLERLAAELPLTVWGYGERRLEAGSPLRQAFRGEAWGLDMYEVLSRSRIAVNRHIEVAEGHANNMRLFEATGVGSLLLTEAASNLGELFTPGTEVVAYDGADDLVEKARHYLEHDEERIAIAAAGQARTLEEHTYSKRVAELARMLETRVSRP